MAEAEVVNVNPPPEWFLKVNEEAQKGSIYLLVQRTNNCADEPTPELLKECQKLYNIPVANAKDLFNWLRAKSKEEDRALPDVACPPRNPLPPSLLFENGNRETGKIHVEQLKQHFLKEGRLSMEDAMAICHRARGIMDKEPNLIRIQDPVTICGDIHGQYFDMMRLFHVGGDPSTTQYLFLGDYVDRGTFSSEVLFLLFAYKIMCPQRIWMLRGNHECRHLTEYFNFREECLYKYNEEVYNAAMNAFDMLPIAAVVNEKFLCVHGGLSPDIRFLKDIDQIDRKLEVPREGPFCDLLWADPADEEQDAYTGNETYKGWFFSNEARHCSYKYGAKACHFFLQKNNLTAIIRGHEVMNEGYKMHFKGKGDIPQVFTIFSAPNYCDAYKNKGSCLKIEQNSLNIRQFVWTSHPYYLPNFMDVFTWSLPFVAEKVTNMLTTILDQVANNVGVDEEVTVGAVNAENRAGLKQKVLAVTRVMKIYNTLKQEQDQIIKLKQLSPNRKLPNGVLAGGREQIMKAIASFESAKNLDEKNEAFPNTPPITQDRRSSTMFNLTTMSEVEQETFVQKTSEQDAASTPSINVVDFELQMQETMKGLVGASRELVDQ